MVTIEQAIRQVPGQDATTIDKLLGEIVKDGFKIDDPVERGFKLLKGSRLTSINLTEAARKVVDRAVNLLTGKAMVCKCQWHWVGNLAGIGSIAYHGFQCHRTVTSKRLFLLHCAPARK
eukprot:jgi/Chrzof1/5286/Cz15g20220.t1